MAKPAPVRGLRLLRLAAGITSLELLSERSGVASEALQRIEDGYDAGDPVTLETLAAVLGCKPNDIPWRRLRGRRPRRGRGGGGYHGQVIDESPEAIVSSPLRAVRLASRLTQRELAEAAGITRRTLARIEADKADKSRDLMARLAEALDTTADRIGYSERRFHERVLLEKGEPVGTFRINAAEIQWRRPDGDFVAASLEAFIEWISARSETEVTPTQT